MYRHYFCFLFLILFHYSSSAIPVNDEDLESSEDNETFNYEECHYKNETLSMTHIGWCMNMIGPDECCLNGRYMPGICSELSHICCFEPDLGCIQMTKTKGIKQTYFFLNLYQLNILS